MKIRLQKSETYSIIKFTQRDDSTVFASARVPTWALNKIEPIEEGHILLPSRAMALVREECWSTMSGSQRDRLREMEEGARQHDLDALEVAMIEAEQEERRAQEKLRQLQHQTRRYAWELVRNRTVNEALREEDLI